MSLQTGLQAIGPAGALKTPALFSAWSAVDKNTLYGGSAGLVVDLATQLPNGVENYSFSQTLNTTATTALGARFSTAKPVTQGLAIQGGTAYVGNEVNNFINNKNTSSTQVSFDTMIGGTLGENTGSILDKVNKKLGDTSRLVISPAYQILITNNGEKDD